MSTKRVSSSSMHRYTNNGRASTAEALPGSSTGRRQRSAKALDSTTCRVNDANNKSSISGGSSDSLNSVYSLILEEASDLAVFWNGSNPVSRFIWKFSPSDTNLALMSIGEVLNKFTAQEYLKHSTVSIPTTKCHNIFSTLRLSDSFLTLFRGPRKGKSVKLIMDIKFTSDLSKEAGYKYLLIIREKHGQKVLWDGRKPVDNLITRVNESQMLMTLESILKKYLPSDYLKQDGTVQQILGSAETALVAENRKLDHVLGSLFKGTRATLLICNGKVNADNNNNVKSPEEVKENEKQAALSCETGLGALEEKRSLESFWLSGNWHEIREKVEQLFDSMDIVYKEKDILPYFDEKLMEERRNLETAMRRRSRSIDEVWRRYEVLKTSVETASESFKCKEKDLVERAESLHEETRRVRSISSNNNNVSNAPEPQPPSDSWHNLDEWNYVPSTLDTNVSCLDVLAGRLREFGVEIYDEHSQVSPLTAMTVTVFVVLVVCAVTHYV